MKSSRGKIYSANEMNEQAARDDVLLDTWTFVFKKIARHVVIQSQTAIWRPLGNLSTEM